MDVTEMPLGVHGEKHMLQLVDEATGYVDVFPLGSTTEVTEVVLDYVDKLVTQGKPVAFLKSDQGSEFVNQGLWKELDKRHITVELSNTYTPQENGQAENVGKTACGAMRTMLWSARLPVTWWPFAAKNWAFSKNRVWHYGVEGVPYKLAFNFYPNLDFVHPLGAPVLAFLPSQLRGATAAERNDLLPVQTKAGGRKIAAARVDSGLRKMTDRGVPAMYLHGSDNPSGMVCWDASRHEAFCTPQAEVDDRPINDDIRSWPKNMGPAAFPSNSWLYSWSEPGWKRVVGPKNGGECPLQGLLNEAAQKEPKEKAQSESRTNAAERPKTADEPDAPTSEAPKTAAKTAAVQEKKPSRQAKRKSEREAENLSEKEKKAKESSSQTGVRVSLRIIERKKKERACGCFRCTRHGHKADRCCTRAEHCQGLWGLSGESQTRDKGSFCRRCGAHGHSSRICLCRRP